MVSLEVDIASEPPPRTCLGTVQYRTQIPIRDLSSETPVSSNGKRNGHRYPQRGIFSELIERGHVNINIQYVLLELRELSDPTATVQNCYLFLLAALAAVSELLPVDDLKVLPRPRSGLDVISIGFCSRSVGVGIIGSS
jgi:hypothetical protein